MCLCCCFPSCQQHNENEVLRAVNDSRILRWCKLPLKFLLPILIILQITFSALLLIFTTQKSTFKLVSEQLINHRIFHDTISENTTGKHYSNLHNYPIISTLTFVQLGQFLHSFLYYFLILQILANIVILTGLFFKNWCLILSFKHVFSINSFLSWVVLSIGLWFLFTIELNRTVIFNYSAFNKISPAPKVGHF